MATRSRIVRIGNSRGLRISKALLELAELTDEVDLYAEPGKLIVQAVRERRAGWAEAAKAMHDAGDDQLLDAPTPTRFDEEEWSW